jgi:hypothetical protein
MDLPSPELVLHEQLALPLDFPPVDGTALLSAPVLAPAHLWASLTPQLRLACQQTLARILQEVVNECAFPREDHTPPS